MIKASELRIGNKINAISSLEGAPVGIIEVMEIYRNGVDSTKYMEYAPDYPFGYPCYPFEGLEGIPLTPEILEKCGFVFNHYWQSKMVDLSQDKDGFFLCAEDPHEGDIYRLSKGFHFFHQLQNLFFALTGEELIVKL
jgi:hypothetical protein